jgi:hypothetical protein
MLGFAIMLMCKNKMFGILLKHRSFPNGEREGDRGHKLDRISEKGIAAE